MTTITQTATGFDPALLAALRGRFEDGYTPETVNAVCSMLHEVTGLNICIIWDLYDNAGYGGDSDYAIFHGGRLYEVESGMTRLHYFLTARGPCPDRIDIKFGSKLKTQTDDGCNFARRNVLRGN